MDKRFERWPRRSRSAKARLVGFGSEPWMVRFFRPIPISDCASASRGVAQGSPLSGAGTAASRSLAWSFALLGLPDPPSPAPDGRKGVGEPFPILCPMSHSLRAGAAGHHCGAHRPLFPRDE
jgi:hypothetical protein